MEPNIRGLQRSVIFGTIGSMGRSRIEALVKKRFDRELERFDCRQKRLDKLQKKKEEEKTQTEEEKIKSIIQAAWGQTGCKGNEKKLSENRKEVLAEVGDPDQEKLKVKSREFTEKELINYILDLAQHSSRLTLRDIRREAYKFAKVKDIHDIFNRINGKDSKDWLHSFLKVKLK